MANKNAVSKSEASKVAKYLKEKATATAEGTPVPVPTETPKQKKKVGRQDRLRRELVPGKEPVGVSPSRPLGMTDVEIAAERIKEILPI